MKLRFHPTARPIPGRPALQPRVPLFVLPVPHVLTCALALLLPGVSAPAQATAPAAESPAAEQPVPAETDDEVQPVLELEKLVVSSSVTPRRPLESALALTTIDIEQIKLAAPRSTLDAISSIPGFKVESSSGEARGNLFTRGLASAGSFEFAKFQEDGLPVFSEGNLVSAAADNYTRVTNWVSRIEAVKGGTSGVFQNGAPAGLVNFIGREGTDVRQGELVVQTSDYNQIRTELWSGGPLNDSTTYAAGVFYRRDDGQRPVGYTANDGYMIQANLKRTFAKERGYAKFYLKQMHDHNTWYLSLPLKNARDPQTIPGGPGIRDGVITSPDLRRLDYTGTPNGDLHFDLQNGLDSPLFYAGAEIELKLADGLKLQNRTRYSTSDHGATYVLLVTTAVPMQVWANSQAAGPAAAGQFAAARKADGNYSYRLRLPGSGGTDAGTPSALNGNGLGALTAYVHETAALDNFQNDFRLLKTFNDGKTTLAGGVYYAWLEEDFQRFGNIIQTEIRNQPRRLDIEYLDATTGASLGYGTVNGIRQLGGAYQRFHAEGDDVALYLNLDHTRGPWSFDAGLRHETFDATVRAEVPGTFNLGTNPALRNTLFGSGTWREFDFKPRDTIWTVGANYSFSKYFSAYARYSDGYKLPNFDNMFLAAVANSADAGPINKVKQYEAGLKYSRRKFAVFATLAGSHLINQFYTGVIVNANGSITNRNDLRDVDTLGLELETYYSPWQSLTLHFVGTLQKSEFASDVVISGVNPATGATVAVNIKGNIPARIPEHQFTFDATYRLPELPVGRITLNAAWQYMGARFQDEANRSELAAYNVVNAGVSLALKRKLTFRLQVANLLSSEGLTEGDPRLSAFIGDPTAVYFNARPVLPRSIVGSVSYNF